MKHSYKSIIRMYAPTFCYVSLVDMFLIIEQLYPDVSFNSIRVIMSRDRKMFDTKTVHYIHKEDPSMPIARPFGRTLLYKLKPEFQKPQLPKEEYEQLCCQ